MKNFEYYGQKYTINKKEVELFSELVFILEISHHGQISCWSAEKKDIIEIAQEKDKIGAIEEIEREYPNQSDYEVAIEFLAHDEQQFSDMTFEEVVKYIEQKRHGADNLLEFLEEGLFVSEINNSLE